MCPIFAAVETDRCDPFVDQLRVLPGAEVAHVVDSAREDEIEDSTAAALQPRLQALTCFCHDFELNRPAGLLLRNRRTASGVAPADDITNPELDEITATQLAVDREVEQCSIAQALVFVEVKANGPDVARTERAFGALFC